VIDFNVMHEQNIKCYEYSNRKPEIRASNMPFCPRQFIFKYRDYYNQEETWDFLGDFYCNIGTSIHSTLQKWIPMANPGFFLGNWKCRRCKIFISFKVGPQYCPNCGNLMEYREFLLNFIDAPVGGHCDGVILSKNETNRLCEKYYKHVSILNINKLINSKKKIKIPALVFEAKSTGLWTIKNISTPYTPHKCQSEIYTSSLRKILSKRYNNNIINIKGYLIKYFSRDNPRIVSDDFIKIVKKNTLYKNTCKMVNLTMDSIRTLKIDKIYNFINRF